MLMVDLFCGRGGWSKGFMAHGWRCIGIDINPQPDYPGEFVQADIAQMTELPPADFYCCSSPCEQFSVHGMKHFHPNPKWPWLGIALFEHSRALLEATGKPYIMENVRCAQKFVGRAVNHCGPFYLWGTGVPAIMPEESYGVQKGIQIGSSALVKTMTRDEKRAYRAQFIWNQAWSSSKKRLRDTAKAAEIPEVISRAVASLMPCLPEVKLHPVIGLEEK